MKLSFRSHLVIIVVAVAFATSSITHADAFTDMDVFNLEWADAPRVSPDGKTIAYVRRGYDVMSDHGRSQIWLVNADGSNHRPLSDRTGISPAWSPDGKRIAFLSGTSQGTEVYMHWLADNRTARISRLTESPSGLTWSPDGKWLATRLFTPTTKAPMIKMPSAPKGAKWAPKAKIIESTNYRADGRGFLREGFTHIYVLPAEGGSPRQITTGDFNHNPTIAWSNDAGTLYFSANRNDDWELRRQDTNLFSVKLADGEITQLTERDGGDNSPALSPDGKRLAYTGFDDEGLGYHINSLYVLTLANGEITQLTGDLDRRVSSPIWDRQSKGLYYQYTDRGIDRLAYQGLRGSRRILSNSVGGLSMTRPYAGGKFHASNNVVAFTQGDDYAPAELAVIRKGKTKQLTDLNTDLLAHKAKPSIEAVTFKSSADGEEIQAWVAKPADFDPNKRYPLILEIHGGPYAAYGPNYSTEVQLYAAAGYVVLYVNPRGSTSYGKRFANLIQHDYPGKDFDDLMSAVDYTIDAGWVDADQLFVTGGSGGGILSAWIVTHTDRFSAAVAQKPVINWYSLAYTTDIYTNLVPYWFAKPPWQDPMSYLNRSPLQFVDQAKTPTMLLTGERDYRTPMSESEQFYQGLKLNSVDTALVRIPNASHGISARPSNLIRKVKYVLAWFERYRREDTDT